MSSLFEQKELDQKQTEQQTNAAASELVMAGAPRQPADASNVGHDAKQPLSQVDAHSKGVAADKADEGRKAMSQLQQLVLDLRSGGPDYGIDMAVPKVARGSRDKDAVLADGGDEGATGVVRDRPKAITKAVNDHIGKPCLLDEEHGDHGDTSNASSLTGGDQPRSVLDDVQNAELRHGKEKHLQQNASNPDESSDPCDGGEEQQVTAASGQHDVHDEKDEVPEPEQRDYADHDGQGHDPDGSGDRDDFDEEEEEGDMGGEEVEDEDDAAGGLENAEHDGGAGDAVGMYGMRRFGEDDASDKHGGSYTEALPVGFSMNARHAHGGYSFRITCACGVTRFVNQRSLMDKWLQQHGKCEPAWATVTSSRFYDSANRLKPEYKELARNHVHGGVLHRTEERAAALKEGSAGDNGKRPREEDAPLGGPLVDGVVMPVRRRQRKPTMPPSNNGPAPAAPRAHGLAPETHRQSLQLTHKKVMPQAHHLPASTRHTHRQPPAASSVAHPEIPGLHTSGGDLPPGFSVSMRRYPRGSYRCFYIHCEHCDTTAMVDRRERMEKVLKQHRLCRPEWEALRVDDFYDANKGMKEKFRVLFRELIDGEKKTAAAVRAMPARGDRARDRTRDRTRDRARDRVRDRTGDRMGEESRDGIGDSRKRSADEYDGGQDAWDEAMRRSKRLLNNKAPTRLITEFEANKPQHLSDPRNRNTSSGTPSWQLPRSHSNPLTDGAATRRVRSRVVGGNTTWGSGGQAEAGGEVAASHESNSDWQPERQPVSATSGPQRQAQVCAVWRHRRYPVGDQDYAMDLTVPPAQAQDLEEKLEPWLMQHLRDVKLFETVPAEDGGSVTVTIQVPASRAGLLAEAKKELQRLLQ